MAATIILIATLSLSFTITLLRNRCKLHLVLEAVLVLLEIGVSLVEPLQTLSISRFEQSQSATTKHD